MSTRYDVASVNESTRQTGMLRTWVGRHRLLSFVLLAYSISWTLLIGGFLGASAGVLDPEGPWAAVVIQLAAAGPLMSALTIVALTSGRSGLADLGRSLIRWRVHPLWYALIFIGAPVLMLTGLAIFYGGELIPLVIQNYPLLFTKLPFDVLAIALFTGLAEEPGWRGFAQPTANQRYQPLLAALVVSSVWAAWHLPNALFGQTVSDTASHFLATTVIGFLLAWAYNSTRSVLIVMLLHGAVNATSGFARAVFGAGPSTPTPTAYYLITALTVGALMLVVAILTRGSLGLKRTREES